MSKYHVTTDDGSVYEVETADTPTSQANEALSGTGLSVSAPKPPATPAALKPDTPMQQVANQIPTYHDPTQGYKEMGEGASAMWNEPTMERKAHGLHQTLAGAAEVAKPLAIAGLASNPVTGGVALASGMGAQKVVDKVAEETGVPEGYREVLGDAAGLGVGAAAGRWINKPTAWPNRAATAISDAVTTRMDPEIALIKGIKPRSNQIKFKENLATSMPEVAESAEKNLGHAIGKTRDGKPNPAPAAAEDDLMEALDAQMKQNYAKQQQALGPAVQMGMRRNLSGVGQAMLDSIGAKARTQNPGAFQRVLKKAMVYDRDFTIPEIEDWLHDSNAEIDSFINKYPADRRAAAIRDPKIAAQVAENNALRKAFYEHLNETGAPPAVKELRRRYGTMMEMKEELMRRYNQSIRMQPDSLAEQVATARGMGRFARGVIRLGHDPLGGLSDMVEGAGGPLSAKWLKEQQTTDAMIRRAFENYQHRPVPVDMRGPPPPAGLLGPGPVPPIPMGPVTDPSGDYSVSGSHYPEPIQRQSGYQGHLLEAPSASRPINEAMGAATRYIPPDYKPQPGGNYPSEPPLPPSDRVPPSYGHQQGPIGAGGPQPLREKIMEVLAADDLAHGETRPSWSRTPDEQAFPSETINYPPGAEHQAFTRTRNAKSSKGKPPGKSVYRIVDKYGRDISKKAEGGVVIPPVPMAKGGVVVPSYNRVICPADLCDKAKSIANGSPIKRTVQLGPWRTGNTPETDINRYISKRPNSPVPGGESFNSFKRRLLGFAKDEMGGDESVTWVTHPIGLKLLAAWQKKGCPRSMEIDTRTMTSPAPKRIKLGGITVVAG